MRTLVVIVGIALSCAGAHRPAPAPVPNSSTASPAARQDAPPAPEVRPDSPPSREARAVDWCDRAYPWSGGPLTSVQLGKDCTASYQEARSDMGGEPAVWRWRIESVRYDRDQKVALVTLEMRQSIGPAAARYRRTYRFLREGRAIAMVGADPVVRIDEPQGAPPTP